MASSRFQNKEGQRVPQATFQVNTKGKTDNLTTDQIFGGKKVVVFGLPGAYTPTCSSSHVPRYNELAPTFKQNGINDVVCIAVNDPFVMEHWAADQRAVNIRFLADGNGTFTEAMGLLVDKSNLGLGKRSWRYSMFVDDGVIKKMFIEPDKEGDPYEVSDAETMLRYINSHAKLPEYTAIFTKEGCPYCAKAKKMLEDHGIMYEEVIIGKNNISQHIIRAVANASTVPQVFMNGKLIGGSEALEKYLSSDEYKQGTKLQSK